MSKFKVGDKVRVCNVPSTSNSIKKNYLDKVYTIGYVRNDYPSGFHYSMVEDRTFFWRDEELCLACSDNEKIVITADGTETLARRYVDGKVVDRAIAKCHPDDKFDFLIGAMVAFDRLVGEKESEEPEKPKYYNGKVVCVKSAFPEYWTVGKVYEFIDGSTFDNTTKRDFRFTSVEQTRHMGDKDNEFIPLVEG